MNEAKDAATAGNHDACIAKLNEGIELTDQRKKRILIGDKSEYGWKTVGEYLDRGLADNDQDANKMKTTEKEAQKKIAETHPAKAAKARPWYKPLRPLGITAINLPSYSLY